jgi:hypothetical protein
MRFTLLAALLAFTLGTAGLPVSIGTLVVPDICTTHELTFRSCRMLRVHWKALLNWANGAVSS